MNRLVISVLILAMAGTTTSLAGEIRILPQELTLHGQEARQQLSVASLLDDRISASIPNENVQLESSDPNVVTIADGIAIAVSNGDATITATSKSGAKSDSTVHVVGADTARPWSFRNDVQSVVSRLGCNAGACHGALAGKGGFRLSLRGYNAKADFLAITREARGRRIEMAHPAMSLVLAKPTGALPHKGGIRLDTDSRNYKVLADWIKNGAAAPRDDDPRLERISVLPETALLSPSDRSKVLVHAHYDNGRVVDVTHWSHFTSTDEAIANVDEYGNVVINGSGEGAVLVWFGSKVALARMTVPYPNKISADVFANAPKRNFIDELNLQQLQTLKLKPSPRCDDETFLRRATLDTIGRLPTIEQRTEYRSQPKTTRRDLLIDRLLASEDFADYWTYRWSDVLVINGTRLRPIAVKSYYEWVHNAVQQNMPWDQFVRDIITATGKSDENGATNFYALHQSPEDMTENACQAFLGLSIGCAKCHNHPLEKWTNDQYYSMANLFARVRAKGWGGDGRNGDGLRTLFVASSGDLVQPGKGKPQPPAPLDSDPLAFDDPNDRREALAAWMTDPSNPYFARAVSNRIWSNFFGRGLVEQVDDLRASNPASNEPLLTATAEHLIDSKFDLKQLMRTILQSETYQRSSEPLDANREEHKYHSRYYPRRQMAEVLLDSIDQVLSTNTQFNQIAFPGADKQDTDFYKEGTRAIQLYDAAVDSYFLKTFGRNPREITCECERSDEPSMVQVLHLSNGETLNPKLAEPKNCIGKMLTDEKSNAEIITSLFTAALCREPTDAELKKILTIIEEYQDDRTTALQDAAWGILTSPEFTFHH